MEEERGARGGQSSVGQLTNTKRKTSEELLEITAKRNTKKKSNQSFYENFAVFFNKANTDLSRLSPLQNSPFSTTSKKKNALRT